jgi:hypothetical protein
MRFPGTGGLVTPAMPKPNACRRNTNRSTIHCGFFVARCRPAAAQMTGLGISPHMIEAILSHVSGQKAGVAGIYNCSNYAAEKAALTRWADHLQAIVDGQKTTWYH